MPTTNRPPHPWTAAVSPIERYTDDPTPPLLSPDGALSPQQLRPSRSRPPSSQSIRPYSDNPTKEVSGSGGYDPFDDGDTPLHLPTPMPGLYDPSGNLLPDPGDVYDNRNPKPTPIGSLYDHDPTQAEYPHDPLDPTIQTNLLPPAMGFGLQSQELVNIPYRPMEPRLKKWAKSEIKPEDVVIPLLLITFQTGVVDAATIKDFHTYTTGQTGNSILMVLAIFGRRPSNLLAAGLSVAGFVLFAIVFGQLGNTYGHKTRGWLLFTMTIQILVLIANTIVVSPALAGVIPEGGPFEWAVIFTAAAGGAGQMVMAINSGVSEINTVGLTGLYCALGSDPTLFSLLSNPHVLKRNRRLWFLVIFWCGCVMGGAIATFSDMWISLVLALECKVVALGMMMFSSAFEVPEDWATRNAGREKEREEEGKEKDLAWAAE